MSHKHVFGILQSMAGLDPKTKRSNHYKATYKYTSQKDKASLQLLEEMRRTWNGTSPDGGTMETW